MTCILHVVAAEQDSWTKTLNPKPYLLQLLDKDNSELVEQEEVCSFLRKLVNMAFRTTKNVLPVPQVCSYVCSYVCF
jgi:hypothetical protein